MRRWPSLEEEIEEVRDGPSGYGRLGEKHVAYRNGWYVVYVGRLGKEGNVGKYKTLSEAVSARNQFLEDRKAMIDRAFKVL